MVLMMFRGLLQKFSGGGTAISLLCAALPGLLGASTANALEQKIEQVNDLAYGVALYEFFQENYFDAAVELLVAKELNRVDHHENDADLLLGGLYLSYGLHQDAEEIFRYLVKKGAPDNVKDKTWLAIGRSRYQKGLWEDAIRALEQIGDKADKQTLAESRVLLANLLMLKRQYPEAAQMLETIPRGSEDAKFAQFNMGIALFKGGRQIEGAEYLSEVSMYNSKTLELKALQDKANLALGFALLSQEETEKSRAFFERVRVHGPFSNKALLGLGWTYAMESNFDDALDPWLELRDRKRLDVSSYESLLAVGYALEKLKAYPQALQSYSEALAAFNDEMGRLDMAINDVVSGRLLERLVTQALGDERGLFTEEGLLEDVPEARYIAHIVSEHTFHEAVKNLKDLKLLRKNLEHWAQALPSYQSMLENRRLAYEERIPQLMPDKGLYKFAAYRDEQALYEEEYRRVSQRRDIKSVATEKELLLLKRLDNMKQVLLLNSQRMEPAKFAVYEHKYNTLRGLLEWDISTTFATRLRKVRKGLNELEAVLADTERQKTALQQARKRAPAGFKGHGRQIKSMVSRIARLQKQLDDVYLEQRHHVEKMIVAEFRWLQERIAEYMDQARFAMARLRDAAAQEGG